MYSEQLENYISRHSSEEDKLLAELTRETHLRAMHPRMLSGHLQGKFLEMTSSMIHPEIILEIGTYTGYSAICLAKGLKEGGTLHTIEANQELQGISDKYFEKAGLKNKIQQHTGNALEIIPTIPVKFDLVFIDADKENYLNYYKLVFDKLNSGAYILADNALWDGKVIDAPRNFDKETKGIVEFNTFVHKDKRVDNMILPLRDGIMLIRKR